MEDGRTDHWMWCEQPREGREEAAVISQHQALGLAGHLMEMRRVRPPERGMSRGKGGRDCRGKEEHIRGQTPLGSRACTSLATDEGALAQRSIRNKGRGRRPIPDGFSHRLVLGFSPNCTEQPVKGHEQDNNGEERSILTLKEFTML